MRINYEDDAMYIMDKVNAELEEYGLEFVCDGLEHDGFEIYELQELEGTEDFVDEDIL